MYKYINTHIFDCNHTISRGNFGGDVFQENKKYILDIIYKVLEHAPFLLASVAGFAGKVDGNQLRLVFQH